MARDLFIPEAPSDGSLTPEAPRMVNPFAAADMVNAHRAPERPAAPRKPEVSLFERITGVRREKRLPDAEPTMDVRSEPRPEPRPETRPEPRMTPATPALTAMAPAAAMPTQAPVAAQAPVQPSVPAEPVQPALWASESAPAPVHEAPQVASPLLGGMDPDDRLSISAETDDPLDIPAFLRRQAN